MLRKGSRVVFNASALLSLLLCVAAVAAGVAGCRRDGGVERLWWVGPHEGLMLYSEGGVVGASFSEGWPDRSWHNNRSIRWTATAPAPGITNRRWIVAEYYSESINGDDPHWKSAVVTYHDVRTAVPYAVLLTGVLPAAWVLARCGKRLRVAAARCRAETSRAAAGCAACTAALGSAGLVHRHATSPPPLPDGSP